MKWGFGIRQKVTLAVILSFILVLFFVKSMLTRNHVHELGSSFSSVYEDRLIVESYIYRLSEILYHKKIVTGTDPGKGASPTLEQSIRQYNESIQTLLAAYEKTKLTKEEDMVFRKLKVSIGQIALLEKQFIRALGNETEWTKAKTDLHDAFDYASVQLGCLSSIQLAEARNLNEHSKKIVAGSALLTEMETGVLIFGTLIIHILIFSSRLTKVAPVSDRHHLN